MRTRFIPYLPSGSVSIRSMTGLAVFAFLAATSFAAPVLTITPITFNVVGLDSNNVNAGPSTFIVGVRVANTGDAAASDVTATFSWLTANANINLLAGSPPILAVPTLAAGAHTDFYFNASITRAAASYNATRQYQITASSSTPGVPAVTTPANREIYVEKLVSQNRNSVQTFTGPTSVAVGSTYTYTIQASTATNGYEQLENFVDFPNVIFQILSVTQTYTAPAGGTNDKLYADACGWLNDITNPGYHKNSSTCAGPCNYTGCKAGGDVHTVYTVKILSTGTADVATVIYDYSGSSYHYNSDYKVPPNSITIRSFPPGDPLFVEYSGFDARAAGVGSHANVTWDTSAEIDNAGFHVYRAEQKGVDWYPGDRLTESIIPAQGNELEGSHYSFTDPVAYTSGDVEGYYIEDIDLGGASNLTGPIFVQVGSAVAPGSGVPVWQAY